MRHPLPALLSETYGVQVPLVGLDKQPDTFVQAPLSAVPIFVLLTATQKTKATRRTINVYSTKPCPSSSIKNLFRISIVRHPLSLAAIEID